MAKFKKGDIVICKKFEVSKALVADKSGARFENQIDDEYFNRKAIIKQSRKDLCVERGCENPEDIEEYHIEFLDDGNSLAWVSGEDLVIADMSIQEMFSAGHPHILKIEEEKKKRIGGDIEAAAQFREDLLSDKVLYDAFTASIASALKEIPIGTGLHDVSKSVADRIIGQ